MCRGMRVSTHLKKAGIVICASRFHPAGSFMPEKCTCTSLSLHLCPWGVGAEPHCRTLLKAPPHHTPWGFSVPWGHNLRVSTCISDLGSDCSVMTAASTISSARAGQPPSSKHQPTHSTSHTLRQRLPPSGSQFKQILQLHVLFFFFFLVPFLFAQQVLGAESASPSLSGTADFCCVTVSGCPCSPPGQPSLAVTSRPLLVPLGTRGQGQAGL